MKKVISVFVVLTLVFGMTAIVSAKGTSSTEIDAALDNLFCSDYKLTNEDLGDFIKLSRMGYVKYGDTTYLRMTCYCRLELEEDAYDYLIEYGMEAFLHKVGVAYDENDPDAFNKYIWVEEAYYNNPLNPYTDYVCCKALNIGCSPDFATLVDSSGTLFDTVIFWARLYYTVEHAREVDQFPVHLTYEVVSKNYTPLCESESYCNDV
ncbi:MAG: hypothetical protein IJQ80_05025, partial [Clostridia bacterium]|nr:hypothetical protein [Clostridia bacterium]